MMLYVEEGVIHYCVANMPGAYARTAVGSKSDFGTCNFRPATLNCHVPDVPRWLGPPVCAGLVSVCFCFPARGRV
jgi:hypothetical protein